MEFTNPQNVATDCNIELEQNSTTLPQLEPIVRDEDKWYHAKSLTPAELCAFIEKAFAQSKNITTYNLPYLEVARERFTKRGRRVPVPGNPSWSEWVDEHLGITDRHVRRLLAAYREEQANQKEPEKAEERRLEAERKKAEAEKKRAEATQKREAAKALQSLLAAKAVELAELIAKGDVENAKKLASAILNATNNSDLLLLPVVGTTPCSGCEQLHSGIAAVLASNIDKPIDVVAEECGVSITVVRQAATRFGLLSVLAPEAMEVASVA